MIIYSITKTVRKTGAKAMIGRKVGYKKRVFVQIFKKIVSKSKILDGSR
jgi:hypothetical protein